VFEFSKRLLGLRVALRPRDGFVVRTTVPLKWFRLVNVTVDVPACPGTSGPNVFGMAMMPKSTAFTLTVVKSENEGEFELAVTMIVASP
jgi:hypothetical protein